MPKPIKTPGKGPKEIPGPAQLHEGKALTAMEWFKMHWMSPKEVMEILEIRPRTYNYYVEKKRITPYEMGSRRFFKVSDIHEYLLKNRKG